ncbi:nucleoside recognition domain-containing protein [Sutterella sp.]|uniref:nucleoside recognition domain-containing protein n=1 Tax=Sutterella sp. TaxID=1981025 RepID=UPI0026E1048A|nr:nucleoside recognition domain-containing protein [Sutterella sp.]MDO5532973.1 nucleoside recognition domain-containing protein [Sutterella sp.]
MSTTTDSAVPQPENPGIKGYISFIFAVLFFSGLLITDEWWGIFDYTILLGNFGQMVSNVSDKGGEIVTAMSNFRGKGGSGAIDGFLFAMSLIPSIMLATAMIAVFEHYGAIRAAERMLNPILRPTMGLPGCCSLAMIASLQSTDAGATLTRTLKESGEITETETEIFATFQMTADAAIGNFLATGIVFFALKNADGTPSVPTTIGVCLAVILLGKVLAANIMRILTIRRARREAAAG